MEGKRIGRLAIMCAAVLTVLAPPPASAADPSPCRVRNVTQDTSGRSLIRMVERAGDGDRLRVRGTCPGQVVIDVDVVISGLGASPAVTGRDRSRALRVARGATVTLRHLAIVDGRSPDAAGAGVFNRGTLSLVEVVVRRNRSEFGAGIANDGGHLTIRRSVVARNLGIRLGSAGGGIFTVDGSLTVIDSHIRRNRATSGAGIASNRTPIHVTDSAIRRNVALFEGGGIANGGSLELTRSAVTANRVREGQGGGILNHEGSSLILDAASSVSGNTPDNCVGTDACTP